MNKQEALRILVPLSQMEARIAESEAQLKLGMNVNTSLAEQLIELEAPMSCDGCWLEHEDRVRCMSLGVMCIRHLATYHPDLYKIKETR